MNILEYNSGFDFIDMMNEFDYEYIKFMGGRANGTYMLGIDDENEMLYMELPVDDYDGRVRKVAALGLKQSIILPRRINYLCDSTTQSGESIKFKRTLDECNIVNQFFNFWMMSFKLKVRNLAWKDSFINRIFLDLIMDSQ